MTDKIGESASPRADLNSDDEHSALHAVNNFENYVRDISNQPYPRGAARVLRSFIARAMRLAAASPAPTPTLSEQAEQAAFEAWAGPLGFNIHRDDSDKYREYHRATTRWAWLAWFARAVLAAAPPTPPEAQPVASLDAARQMGAKGGPASESERLAFEAWMAGHCWALCATWDGTGYRSDSEQGGEVDPRAMATRGKWAAWRDRAALASLPPAEPARMLTDEEIDALHDNAREALAMEMGFGGEGDAMSTDTRKHTRWRRWLIRQARAASVNAGRSIRSSQGDDEMSDTPPGPRWAERKYITTYHRNDYTLADAFRPQPGWGQRVFSVPASVFGEHAEADVIEEARLQAPDGYRLTCFAVQEPGAGEQVLWSTAPDQRLAKAYRADRAAPKETK